MLYGKGNLSIHDNSPIFINRSTNRRPSGPPLGLPPAGVTSYYGSQQPLIGPPPINTQRARRSSRDSNKIPIALNSLISPPPNMTPNEYFFSGASSCSSHSPTRFSDSMTTELNSEYSATSGARGRDPRTDADSNDTRVTSPKQPRRINGGEQKTPRVQRQNSAKLPNEGRRSMSVLL